MSFFVTSSAPLFAVGSSFPTMRSTGRSAPGAGRTPPSVESHHGEQILSRIPLENSVLTLLFLEAVLRRSIIIQRAVHVLVELRHVVIELLKIDRRSAQEGGRCHAIHLLCQEARVVMDRAGFEDLLEAAWKSPFTEGRVLVLPAAVDQLEELGELTRPEATSVTRGQPGTGGCVHVARSPRSCSSPGSRAGSPSSGTSRPSVRGRCTPSTEERMAPRA